MVTNLEIKTQDLTRFFDPTTDSHFPGVVYDERTSPSGFTIVTMPDGREVEFNRYHIEKKLGITITHTSKMLSGVRWPSFDMALRISHFIGISVEEFHWVLIERPKWVAMHKRTHAKSTE